jgi:hypothetical protein
VSWRPHTETPHKRAVMSALIAVMSDEGERSEPFILGIYLWRDGRWVCEDSDRPLAAERFWWMDELDLLAAIPQQTKQEATI